MLHIVFGESAGGTLRLALREAGRDDEVLSFNDDLSFGPIHPPVPVTRAAWARAELHFPDNALTALYDETEKFWHIARSVQERIVWFSRHLAREFCGFLELVSQMSRQSYTVIDLTGLTIPHRMPDGTRVNRAILSLAELNPEIVRENALWDWAAPLSAEEGERYSRLWKRLSDENAPFRVVEGDAVTSASIEVYDDLLLSCLTRDWCRAARTIGDAMTRGLGDPRYQAGDLVLFGRLRKLIDAGKVESRGDLATPRGCEVRMHRPLRSQ
jgi:Protein of unknown function/Domain of unknown function (DUF1835)